MDSSANFLSIGSTLNNGTYRVDKYLASGGFGNTYVVTHQHFQKQFVMKELFLKGINERDDNSTTVSVSNADNKDLFEQHRRKFLKEARRLSDLRNKHIVMVYDLFEDNATAYYVMDYIKGQSLRDVISQQGGGLGNQMAWNCLNQMLEALDEIHAKSIWHLDIKPGNIMCDANGHLTLIDFGASKMIQGDRSMMTTSTATAYTPGYAPIEQVEGNIDKIGAHTDLYSLGATLYKLVTGDNPPQYSDIISGGKSIFRFPMHVSEKMQHLIVWMMSPSYSERPQSVDDIRQRLKVAGNTKQQIDSGHNRSSVLLNEDTIVKRVEQGVTPSGGEYSSKGATKWFYAFIVCACIALFAIGGLVVLKWSPFGNFGKEVESTIPKQEITTTDNKYEIPSSHTIGNEGLTEKELSREDDLTSDQDNLPTDNMYDGYHSYSGYFVDNEGRYPVELSFSLNGSRISDCVYKNVTLGGKIRMRGSIENNRFIFKGKDGRNEFIMKLGFKGSTNNLTGIAIDGSKQLDVELYEN